MHKCYTALALCCSAAALAGCGSSANSASNPSGTGAANTSVFKSELNALCQQGNAAAKAGGTPAAAMKVIDQTLPKFKALTAQGSLEATYQLFLANLEAEAAALKTGNTTAIKAAEQKNHVLAKQLGAPACA